jgi:hypothetical protein
MYLFFFVFFALLARPFLSSCSWWLGVPGVAILPVLLPSGGWCAKKRALDHTGRRRSRFHAYFAFPSTRLRGDLHL